MNLSGEKFVIKEGERLCQIILTQQEHAGRINVEGLFGVELKVVDLDTKEKSNYELF